MLVLFKGGANEGNVPMANEGQADGVVVRGHPELPKRISVNRDPSD
jgi:hypothetical protein